MNYEYELKTLAGAHEYFSRVEKWNSLQSMVGIAAGGSLGMTAFYFIVGANNPKYLFASIVACAAMGLIKAGYHLGRSLVHKETAKEVYGKLEEIATNGDVI